MKRAFIRRGAASGSSGQTILLVAISMVAIVAMAALSIDTVTLYLARTQTQTIADSAALTAARVIAVSGIMGDPSNSSSSWQAICGGTSSPATLAATAVANQNLVARTAASTVNVSYLSPTKSPAADCSTLDAAFAVNPMVTVQVQRTNLPTFFSRMWGAGSNSVSATATAEAFNSSNSYTYSGSGNVIPVQPRCVKPWLLPNADPGQPGLGPFLNSDGTIAAAAQGIRLSGGTSGIVGDTFDINANCTGNGSPCSPRSGAQTQAGVTRYWPGQTLNASAAVPSCGTGSFYEEAVAGCDQSTVYACGVANSNSADLSNNPKGTTGDSVVGGQCLIDEQGGAGQDLLDTTAYPFKMTAGANNLMVAAGSIATGAVITSSPSIVSIPIYDNNASPAPVFTTGGVTAVTVIGFLQVFINNVNNGNSRINVTVLNVSGCGNGSTVTVSGTPVTGTSPVPVRLIKYP